MLVNDNILRDALSKNIKKARISAGLTQEKLSENSDISLSFLKDVETGKSGISLLTLINICNSLNTTPNELLKDFFKEPVNNTMDIYNKISLLNSYQKDAVITLIDFFYNHNK